jgi:hypothetical protein
MGTEKLRLLNDVIQLGKKVAEQFSSLKADLTKARTRLTMFELLAKDARFGKWYLGYVEFEHSLIKRLRQYIAESEYRIAQIDGLLSEVLHMRETG